MTGLPFFSVYFKLSMSSYFKASASNPKTFGPFTSYNGVVPSSVVPHAIATSSSCTEVPRYFSSILRHAGPQVYHSCCERIQIFTTKNGNLISIKTNSHKSEKRYPLQKAWYFDRIYRIYRILTLRYILSILSILSNNF
jgi:hypothetical protein